MKPIIAILVILAPGWIFAQQAADDITPTQVEEYKARLVAGCVKDAILGGISEVEARSFCSCTNNYIAETMPFSQWQLASLQFLRTSEAEEMKVLLPYIRRAARECKSNLSQQR
jgi:hypothetical protein